MEQACRLTGCNNKRRKNAEIQGSMLHSRGEILATMKQSQEKGYQLRRIKESKSDGCEKIFDTLTKGLRILLQMLKAQLCSDNNKATRQPQRGGFISLITRQRRVRLANVCTISSHLVYSWA
jgi:hypothetical protein